MHRKTYPIFLVFLVMGFGDVVGPLVGLVKETFRLSYTMAQLVPFSGFIMFGILSVPMGIYQDKKGKKRVLVLGLIVAFIGLVIPMLTGLYGARVEFNPGEYVRFYIVLLSILLLCAGATILQVVGNPIMRDVSPEGKFSRNLSLAQSVKAVGSSLGFLLPPFAAIAFGYDWTVLFPVYSALIAVTLLFVGPLKVVETKDPASKPATIGSCVRLLGNGYVFMMVSAIFLYVGAEVCMSSGVPLLLRSVFGIGELGLWVSWALFFLPILAGRFAGSVILGKMKPRAFLRLTLAVSAAGLLAIFSRNETLTFLGIVMAGLGFANIFPLVFSITIDHMPQRSNELSGLMITAIAGGAVVPVIMGKVTDMTQSVLTGFVVPMMCLVYIVVTATMSGRRIEGSA